MLGGEIGFDSEPGRGSLFWATAVFEKRTAPAAEAPALPANSETGAERALVVPTPGGRAPTVAGGTAKPPVARGRVLLAEDNLMNQKVALRLLQKAGYAADVAGNGRLAVEAWRGTAYDLVLMDCQMPEMDGFEATAEIRRMEGKERHTIIVALTANAMVGDSERCLRAGMDDYLSKPFDLAALERAIHTWVAKDGPKPKAPEKMQALLQRVRPALKPGSVSEASSPDRSPTPAQ
jgi:CheY-like chemotaxis protein